jgi:hypothetical protein
MVTGVQTCALPIWRDDRGRRVSNGIYFYRIEIEGSDPQWGKIFVLQ